MQHDDALKHPDFEYSPSQVPPCPRWKKALAAVLVVAAVTLSLFATVWADRLDFSWTYLLEGLALSLGYAIALVLAGIVIVSGLLWLVSQSRSLMNRGRATIEYLVHCYPRQIKDRILHS